MAINVTQASAEHAAIIADFNQAMALETENKLLDRNTILPGVSTMLGDESLGFYLIAETDISIVGCLGVT